MTKQQSSRTELTLNILYAKGMKVLKILLELGMTFILNIKINSKECET